MCSILVLKFCLLKLYSCCELAIHNPIPHVLAPPHPARIDYLILCPQELFIYGFSSDHRYLENFNSISWAFEWPDLLARIIVSTAVSPAPFNRNSRLLKYADPRWEICDPLLFSTPSKLLRRSSFQKNPVLSLVERNGCET